MASKRAVRALLVEWKRLDKATSLAGSGRLLKRGQKARAGRLVLDFKPNQSSVLSRLKGVK